MEKVYEAIKNCGVFYLATVDGDQPHVRPFGAVALFEGKVYIQTGKIKPVAHQMKANPKIEIAGMMKGGGWARITCEAVLDERIEAQEHMLEENPGLKNMYKAGDGNTEVYYLQNGTLQVFAGSEQETVKF